METTKGFNLNTVQILSEKKIFDNLYECKVIGKYHNGKRYKRGFILLNQSQIRDIRLRDLLKVTP